jgi:hypothetical protein
MKKLKLLLVLLMCLVSFAIAGPASADPIAKKSPDYPVVTQALNDLLQLQKDPNQTTYKSEELQQKIADAKLQKYLMESVEGWGTCRNETGKTLAVYAHKPKASAINTLYYLGAGQETDDDWDCDGIYLPSDAKLAGFSLAGADPIALKILDGSRLVTTTNPATGEMELNLPLALTQLVKAGEVNGAIPAMAQADIDAQPPNAPID